jgi:ribosomal protein S18 acetylase RimI-like enzyme
MAFTLAGAPELEAYLLTRGFAVGTYRYLRRTLSPVPDPTTIETTHAAGAYTLRAWRPTDAQAVTRVLAEAYADADPLRPFGGDGQVEDWTEYLLQLTTETGCGRFCGNRSVIAESPSGVDGAALITDLGGGTSHLAQLIVAPRVHGSGLGRRLLSEATRHAGRAGFARMTLLVSEQNHVARALYDRHGFDERAAFVTAAN